MKATDRKQFVEVVVGFAELRGKQLSPAALELYWRALRHWELEDFLSAAEHLLRDCEYMPTPYNFEKLRRAGQATAGEAWGIVLDCARHGLELPEDDLLRRAVRAIGGIKAVAMSETSRTPFLERRFAEHYETMQDADEAREAVPQIAHSGSGPTSARDLLKLSKGGGGTP